MDEQYTPIISEAERLERRKQRAVARRKKQLARRRRLILQFLPVAVLVLAVLISLIVWAVRREPKPEAEPVPPPAPVQTIPEVLPPEPELPFAAETTATTAQLGANIDSRYAVLIDPEKGTILAEKESGAIISPPP